MNPLKLLLREPLGTAVSAAVVAELVWSPVVFSVGWGVVSDSPAELQSLLQRSP